MNIIEEGEQCIDCLRYGYDPHQDVCLLCGRGQLRPDSDDDDSMADIIPEDWCGGGDDVSAPELPAICCDTCPYTPTCEEERDFLTEVLDLDDDREPEP